MFRSKLSIADDESEEEEEPTEYSGGIYDEDENEISVRVDREGKERHPGLQVHS